MLMEDHVSELDLEQAKAKEFERQWDADTLPACPNGLTLLRNFAEAHPSLYILASQNHFIDPTHPAVRTNRMWLAFAAHCSICENCNEV